MGQKEYHYRKRELARGLRKQQTPAEQHLWQYLRKRQLGGYRFRRQVNIGRYIVDFVCFEARVIIELDGGQHLTQQQAYDQVRDDWLTQQQFQVLRFPNHEVLNNTETTLTIILQTLTN